MATQAQNSSIPAQQARLSASLIERVVSIGVLLMVAGAIILGWQYRHALPFDPEQGIGYALGIAGGSMMLFLLAYPVRKRTRTRSRAAGSIGFWFRLHMFLGLAGPLAILFHSRFTFGALNSAVALGAMIIVASSGLIGRFFYSRVHRGYSDRKLELRSLKQEMDGLLALLATSAVRHEDIRQRMQPFEDAAVAAGGAFWSSARAVLGLSWKTRSAQRRLRASIERSQHPNATALQDVAAAFFEAVRRAAEFAFYDRMLRLWHLLHLPLFVLLVAAAVLHIVAVHMY